MMFLADVQCTVPHHILVCATVTNGAQVAVFDILGEQPLVLKGKGLPCLSWKVRSSRDPPAARLTYLWWQSSAFSGKLDGVVVVDAALEDEAGEVLWAVAQPCVLAPRRDGDHWMDHTESLGSFVGEADAFDASSPASFGAWQVRDVARGAALQLEVPFVAFVSHVGALNSGC